MERPRDDSRDQHRLEDDEHRPGDAEQRVDDEQAACRHGPTEKALVEQPHGRQAEPGPTVGGATASPRGSTGSPLTRARKT